MAKKYFTDKEIKDLSNNPYVNSVSKQIINYTDEFRRIFIAGLENGKLPREIFEENGFDCEVLGTVRINRTTSRWRAAYKELGVEGLEDKRKNYSGKTAKKELNLEEQNARLEAQINLLKAENEFLKKLDMLERGLRIDK